MNITFTLDSRAMKHREERFGQAQKYIDSECIKLMTPFVPVALPYYKNAGKLRDSVENPEPGVIVYMAPKARHDYTSTVNHAHGGNPQAQRLWFEVMKAHYATAILKGTAKILGCDT